MQTLLKKYKGFSIVAKATIWYMLCSILQKGISVITTPIFTRLLTTEEYGLYSIYVSWESIFIIFTSLRLDYTVFNKGMSKYKDDRNGYVASMQILTTIFSIICLGIYLLFRYQINAFTELTTSIILLILLQCLVYPSYNFWMLKERYEYRYIRFTIVVILMTVINSIIGVFAVMTLPGNHGYIRIVTNVLVYSVVGIVLYIVNFRKGIKNAKKEYMKFAILFNIPMIPHYLSMYILQQSDRIMIQKIIGIVQTGIYSVAYNAGMVINIISTSLVNAITPWYYESLGNKKFNEVKKIFLPLMFGMCSIVFAFLLFVPEIMKIFAAKEYYEAIYIIPPISASIIFSTMYSFFSIPEYYYDANKFSMVASLTSAIINIVTNYIFINLFGYLAAGFTTLFCNIIMAIGHYIYARYVMEKRGLEDFFPISQVIFITLLTISFVIIMCLLYKFIIVRYIIVAICVIIVFLFRERFFELYKMIREK